MTTESLDTMARLVDLFEQYVFACSSEAVLHQAVHQCLVNSGFMAEPEYVLSVRDRIDFYVPDGRIGVECKINGSATEVIRQLLRYTESPQIDGLILLTSRSKHRVPPTLGGKPVFVVLTRVF